MAMYTNILVEEKDQIAWVTINRPSFLNALNKETIQELHNAFSSLNENAQIGVIILTGSGEKSFVAGADIKEFSEFTIAQGGE
jgi:enoyl-CoA hydratase